MFLLSAALAAGVTGCKHKTPMTTPIPDNGGRPSASSASSSQSGPGAGETAPMQPPINTQPIALDNGSYSNLFNNNPNENREQFKADTIFFDFDSATIKASEESKLQEVANYFKNNSKFEGLIIEGNCDERGTEKYNLSLGERRALAAREYLANLGVDAHRLKTVTYGASHPVDPGHEESAWKQNRRDDFVLATPKQ